MLIFSLNNFINCFSLIRILLEEKKILLFNLIMLKKIIETNNFEKCFYLFNSFVTHFDLIQWFCKMLLFNLTISYIAFL